ncbi:MAG: metallophosphoesterase family protein [Proteobacteria bacterium]|nr:metallophosphoesterase family protein [Pseudomonadota bacterium]MBU1139612.1 metallophosphoesterase family protein [Pseudomonadota bacterium]MBU1232700.1 metallophosphoesterase family protein [Pseudomonadota bacterium]MBU1418845.1 metallophosphoesterase family protein [Pseudomonadota bacterium]MBU1455731.1 metallophosphoesterase family protein [Pseudomonadota bacterium]
MRIIAFGDIHMSLGNFAKIPDISSADLIILTGDLTNYGSRHDARDILNQVLAVNPHVLAQVGNLDDFAINDYLDALNMNIHGQARLFRRGVCLMGCGGSNPTPFNTLTEFSEIELGNILEQAYLEARNFIELAQPLERHQIPLILVSHTPPLNTALDLLPDGSHVGSSAVRSFIERNQPPLCLTGHIHEAKGSDRIGETLILNPGMINKGGWIDILIDNKGKLKATVQ